MPDDEFIQYMNQYGYMNLYGKKIPLFLSYAGIFNARSPLFWEGDSENHEASEGSLLNNFLISNHLIDEPTHVRGDGSQSCIDLICTDQPTLRETGVFSSLDPHSQHNMVNG